MHLNHHSTTCAAAADQKEVTYPTLVDALGNHLSNDVTTRLQRYVDSNRRAYIKIDAFGESYILNLTQYSDFIRSTSGSQVVEYVLANGTSRQQSTVATDCHYIGHVTSVRDLIGGEEVATGDSGQWVSISSCIGLVSACMHYCILNT